MRHSPRGVETCSSSPDDAAAKPCRRAHAAVTSERFVQKVGISVDQYPVLPPADDRCQEAEQAAGAGAKIEQARSQRQPIGQAPRQRHVARGMIERFAQREPVSGEAFDHEAGVCHCDERSDEATTEEARQHYASAWANSRACVRQFGSAWPTCHAASAIAWRKAVPKINRRSAFERLMWSPAGHTTPDSGVTSLPAAPPR